MTRPSRVRRPPSTQYDGIIFGIDDATGYVLFASHAHLHDPRLVSHVQQIFCLLSNLPSRIIHLMNTCRHPLRFTSDNGEARGDQLNGGGPPANSHNCISQKD
ncbi:hypothetical protein K443DRAFT_103325 [Laccaria amethystina LaAM-08-1]|uniref:Uncharacterized protein n=1 Tax=Laccaria amethystina LaAM-08-1 TaxID=1095629 RepID=A0A0C9WN41_9AGAR|nr:hypothetical protein K443DRAFT_103325 [Laccaria amethystina LaAM-08-1]